ncbi:MAG: class II aldolase/adducin family protein [Gammaproteobacteria bacterium]|nr:class II aldolase/adducin family protein [Gammaproteobacteria bacterium]
MAKTARKRGDLTRAHRKLREDLAACYRLLAHFRMTDLIYTHCTLRVPGPERRYLINPYGLMWDEISASDLVLLEADGTPVGSRTPPINLAGFVIHGAIHESRDDAHCIIHTHTLAGCAIAAQRDGLLPVNQISLEFHGRVAYHDYEGISYDLDERQRLVRDLGDRPVMIMRNHGLLTVGATVAQAFLRMFYLEKACEIQLAAQGTGQPLSLPSEEICRKAERQFNAPPPPPEAHLVNEPNDLAWEALLRLLKRVNPGWKR